ncbi:copper-fist-domain-containing protein [Acephala macrosclerotiorum]|nr:copper-fist-domain-containing protein [Acephala macrosclerotiorum]
MPVINGFKYSCEPCIRGHRATSCKHTDRILIEVRKPGRPLESCGHNLATCNCGKVASLFSVGEIFSAPLNEELAKEEVRISNNAGRPLHGSINQFPSHSFCLGRILISMVNSNTHIN